MQATGYRSGGSPSLVTSNHQSDFTFGCLQPVGALHGTPLLTAQNDNQPQPLCSLLPSNQRQCILVSGWTVKSENTNDCVSAPNPAAGGCCASGELCSSSSHGQGLPQLVMEFLRCDPDELQLQSKTAARLLQEQTGWSEQGSPSTFNLMCLMADQMLFFMVEWARTSVFFKQLKVRTPFTVYLRSHVPSKTQLQAAQPISILGIIFLQNK